MLCSLLTLVLASGMVWGEKIYKQKTESGKPPVYTDQPAPDAEEIELPPTMTVPATEPQPMQAETEQANEPDQPYDRLAITAPGGDGVVPNGLSPPPVQVAIEPALFSGHVMQILVNGEVAASGQKTTFTFSQLPRASVPLQAVVVDRRGEAVQRSEPVEIFVYWPGPGV